MASDSGVVVFGGTGFIGGHVARMLRDTGFPVTVFKRRGTVPVTLDGISFLEGDLGNPADLKNTFEFPKVIFAAGYYPLVGHHADRQAELARTQVTNFFTAINPNADVVFVSSISTIGRGHAGVSAENPADERNPYDLSLDRSPYYRIKHELEKIALGYATTRKGRTVVVNPSAVFGELDIKPTTSRIVIDAARGRLAFRLKGETNAADVHDVAKGIIQALEKGTSGERYILGGENLTLTDLVGLACEVTGAAKPRMSIPLGLVRVLANVSEGAHSLFHLNGSPLLPRVGVDLMQNATYVSSAKAELQLGYKHGPVKPALERAWQWFRRNGYV
jgi:dihydroflavonol-4-reductase